MGRIWWKIEKFYTFSSCWVRFTPSNNRINSVVQYKRRTGMPISWLIHFRSWCPRLIFDGKIPGMFQAGRVFFKHSPSQKNNVIVQVYHTMISYSIWQGWTNLSFCQGYVFRNIIISWIVRIVTPGNEQWIVINNWRRGNGRMADVSWSFLRRNYVCSTHFSCPDLCSTAPLNVFFHFVQWAWKSDDLRLWWERQGLLVNVNGQIPPIQSVHFGP